MNIRLAPFVLTGLLAVVAVVGGALHVIDSENAGRVLLGALALAAYALRGGDPPAGDGGRRAGDSSPVAIVPASLVVVLYTLAGGELGAQLARIVTGAT